MRVSESWMTSFAKPFVIPECRKLMDFIKGDPKACRSLQTSNVNRQTASGKPCATWTRYEPASSNRLLSMTPSDRKLMLWLRGLSERVIRDNP